MKIKSIILMSVISMLFSFKNASAQKVKRTHTFSIERVIPSSAEKVWNVVGNEFADVSKYHAGIVKSELINGSTKSEIGCERVCQLDDKGKKLVREELVEFDEQTMYFKAKVFDGEGVPTVPEYTFAEYEVKPIDEERCKLIITQTYRTKPAFIGGIVKGKFKQYTKEQMIFIEHYVLTGEAVSKENQKEILGKYQ
ncbi:SRPBCC family protein [Flammeovirga sp. SubArs3]|uniref:SRPBCC family protein n=1 Tax=Flammeovirga sp. SubArs3 TaxID=2995316 RepID=UPI00248B5865|nr:SRPBCC family protein [Flammeovirga sp. SubArs3]